LAAATCFGVASGQDTLSGGDGDHTPEEERGNDVLSGGDGNDALRGGARQRLESGDNASDTPDGRPRHGLLQRRPGTDTNTDVKPSQGDTWDGT
jgi:Ca2+-binding RTX toxin-like protein